MPESPIVEVKPDSQPAPSSPVSTQMQTSTPLSRPLSSSSSAGMIYYLHHMYIQNAEICSPSHSSED